MCRLILVFLLTATATIGLCQVHPGQSQVDHYFNLVRSELKGEEAFATVAFMDNYWRLAGNEGFDKSIRYVATKLKLAGFVEESESDTANVLTYRIEERSLDRPTWEPLDASITIVGEDQPLLDFKTNRNMIAIRSWSTDGVVEAEVVYLTDADVKDIENQDIDGKIVFVESNSWRVFEPAIRQGGAIGLLLYNNPDYLKPEINVHSIQFGSIPLDTLRKPWAIYMSYLANERLKKALARGKTEVKVDIKTKMFESTELTLVADVRGKTYPHERLVFSAHVQEPGANDNASGVGAQTEMAVVTAKLVGSGAYMPERTITFLFGDEIVSTRRYIEDDSVRSKSIRWGISLDMVGENTELTGGSFLIEKMPDPGAVFLRGDDKHTEWGGRPLKPKDVKPYYLNDFAISIFEQQGIHANWVVKSNPFEGGSDHVPFLRADIPGLLLWHFTDQFYHTDGDRIDKVSAKTLENVAVGALVTGYSLVNADDNTFEFVISTIDKAARQRLNTEYQLSTELLNNGGVSKTELEILSLWTKYYQDVLDTTKDLIHPSQWNDQNDDHIQSSRAELDSLSAGFQEKLSRTK